ncbi:MAG: hypothetical protein V3V49_06310, partial [Candidatus Krumholzibacteria bacterium]
AQPASTDGLFADRTRRGRRVILARSRERVRSQSNDVPRKDTNLERRGEHMANRVVIFGKDT